eukprot:scaffold15763_cov50-Phaeocystis_antarctica.AAC.3
MAGSALPASGLSIVDGDGSGSGSGVDDKRLRAQLATEEATTERAAALWSELIKPALCARESEVRPVLIVPACLDAFARAQLRLACRFRRPPPALARLLVELLLLLLLLGFPPLLPRLAVHRGLQVQPELLPGLLPHALVEGAQRVGPREAKLPHLVQQIVHLLPLARGVACAQRGVVAAEVRGDATRRHPT